MKILKTYIIIILSISSFIFGCKGSEKVSEKEDVKTAASETPVANPNCLDLIIDADLYNNTQSESVRILERKIEGNYLYLKYTFSGCPSDEIYLVWNSMLKKSYPGQASIKLGFEETGSCDEMHTKEACYNLKDFVQYKKVVLTVNKAEGILFDVTEK